MAQVVYESPTAILSFDYHELMAQLGARIKEHRHGDDSKLRSWLQKASADGARPVTISHKDHYEAAEYLDRIIDLISHLLSDGKGFVYCKQCNRNIPPSARRTEPPSLLGTYSSRGGEERSEAEGLTKKTSEPGNGCGGSGFFCETGHELLSTGNGGA